MTDYPGKRIKPKQAAGTVPRSVCGCETMQREQEKPG